VVAVAIAPLKQRFAAAGESAIRFRAALLEAMASIGAPEFATEFLANLDTDQPELLLPAIEGIKTIGDASRIDRVLALTASSDARVRRRAIEALAALGSDPAHLEAMVSRLSPASEPGEAVRQAAWDGFRAVLSTLSPATRLHWAGRLQDLPELEEQYLVELANDLAGGEPPPAELSAVRRRLAERFDAQQRFAESFPLWRGLWHASTEAGDAAAPQLGLSYLRAMLRVGRHEMVGELAVNLVSGADQAVRDEVQVLLLAHLTALREAGDDQQLEPYLAALELLPPDAFSQEFKQAILDARAGLPSADEAAAAESTGQ
jgi:hypothetical protein